MYRKCIIRDTQCCPVANANASTMPLNADMIAFYHDLQDHNVHSESATEFHQLTQRLMKEWKFVFVSVSVANDFQHVLQVLILCASCSQ